MTTTHTIFYLGDLYELVLHGHVISSITCYDAGSQRRQEVNYDLLSEDLQDKILTEVVKKIRSEKK